MTAKQETDKYAPPSATEAIERLMTPPSLEYLNDVRGGPSADLFRDAAIVNSTLSVEFIALVRRIAVTLDEINGEVSAIAVSVAKTP